MFIALAVLFISIVAIMFGLAVWRIALRGKASKEAKDANQPAPKLTWQDFVNGFVLLLGLVWAALGIIWAWNKRTDQKAKEAVANGRR